MIGTEDVLLDGECATVEWLGLAVAPLRIVERGKAAQGQRHPDMATVAYANSASDFDHLQLADEAWLVNPTAALLRDAVRQHFYVVIWR